MADAGVIFVDDRGVSSGACGRAAPCGLAFGLSLASPARNHMKIVSGTLQLAASLTLGASLYIEGSDTIVTGPSGMFALPQNVNVTLSHLRLQPASGLVTTVDALRTLRLFDIRTTGGIQVNGGALDVDRSTFTGGDGLACSLGSATVRRSAFDHSVASGTSCQLVVLQNRFEMSGDRGFGATNGVLTFENNLVIQTEGAADSMVLNTLASTSIVAFNTFVNMTAQPSVGLALNCDSAIQVSSNIFAYRSTSPVAAECRARYSLFDSVAAPGASAGTGNKSADGGGIFVDGAVKDFHLAASSPARGAAEAGLGVMEDHDGTPRPSPAGSQPDMGAFEAP